MSGPSIQVSRLGLSLGGTAILKDVDLQIAAGHIHCVVGPNGGGKTSLIRCLLGQMPHTGTVAVHWSDNRVTGYVPQFLDFDKSLPVTAGDFMSMICQPRRPVCLGSGRRGRLLAEEALERVGLKGKLRTRFGNLSGGERQRVLFAQGLVPQPGLLVLDEPMASMDEVGADIFTRLIGDLAGEGVTIVWIAHELPLVRKLADVVTCIDQTVLFSGAPEVVLGDLSAEQLFRRTTVRAPRTEAAPA